MTISPIDVLLRAIDQRWSRDDRFIDEVDLVNLGSADVERPGALCQVIKLRRNSNVHAVIALVALDEKAMDPATFDRVRHDLRTIAHYVATHLNPPALVDDAQVWAVAPSGSDGDPFWTRLREEVHQDTWSVPKSIWLPGNDPAPEVFLEQGILAEPWETQQGGRAESLDLLDRFAKKLGQRGSPWARERVRQLLDGLTDGEADPAKVAHSLLQLAEDG